MEDSDTKHNVRLCLWPVEERRTWGQRGHTDGGTGTFCMFLGVFVIPQSLRQCLEQSGIFCSVAELHMLALGD